MRRFLLATSLLAGLVAFGPKPASAAISADINLHIGRRAPHVYFRSEPRGYLIPSSDVYYFDDDYGDYDMFQYGSWYYVNDGGDWYRSRSWRGPFIGVSFETVPSRIFRVPSRYHHQTRGWYAPQRQWDNGPRYRNDRGYRNDRDWNNNDRRGNDRRGRNHRRDWNNGDDRQWNNGDDQGNGRRRGRGDDQD